MFVCCIAVRVVLVVVLVVVVVVVVVLNHCRGLSRFDQPRDNTDVTLAASSSTVLLVLVTKTN